MTARSTRRAGLSALLATALVLPFSGSASADDDKVVAYSPTTGLRSPGISKAACSTYPSGRDINVTRKMYEVAHLRQVSAKVMLAMFEAGWVESWLNNLNCGDRDSIGIFQMRPSMGWGTYQQLRDVTYQVNKFINVALPLESRYSTAGQLAQAVERSGYPYRYDQAQATAQKYINEAAVPYGGIGALWRSLGGSAGILGGPLAPEHYFTSGAKKQQFSNGIIYWTLTGGAVAVRGGVYGHYSRTGGYATYGLPTMKDEVTVRSVSGTPGKKHLFQRGAIFWSIVGGAKTVNARMRPAFEAAGAERVAGFPVNNTTTDSAGKSTQTFEKLVITVSSIGSVVKTPR